MRDRAAETRQPAGDEPSVLIAEDRALVRAGMVALLDGFDIVDTGTLAEMGPYLRRHQPDILVVGIHDRQSSAFSLISRAVAENPRSAVIAVANSATMLDLREAVIAGVRSFLLLSLGADDLGSAVRRTAAGERVVAPSIALQLADSFTTQGSEDGISTITERERQVLEAASRGLTNDQIAQALDIPARTVKTHIQKLLTKLDVADRTAAVARAIRVGLIT